MSRTTIIAVTALAGGLAIYYIATGRRRRREHRERRERSLLKLCQSLPKAELHAHLHGCARLSTIAELAPAGGDTSALTVASGDNRSLDACFGIFAAIHKTVTNHKAVERVCREVLEDFAADNVQYLELRTTPRALDDADAEGYIRVVIRELEEFQFKPGNTMRVRLLLSIDRTGSLEKALETVQLAAKFRQAYVVGVDFSGNPTKGSFAQFVPAFALAREFGLKVVVHSGEVDHPEDTASILSFRPERLGHALLLSESDFENLRFAPIPIELCPTSNVMTLRIPKSDMSMHPTMRTLIENNYPVSISTDDSTVFNTTSSNELYKAACACELDEAGVVALAKAAWSHGFDQGGGWEKAFDQAARRAVEATAEGGVVV